MKRSTIQEIAEELSLSPTTISFILNGKSERYKISKATQQKVLDFVEKRNFRPNAQARSLTSGKTFTIGFIVPDISDRYYAKIAKGIEDIIEPQGYQIIMASTEENPKREQSVVNSLLARRIDGVIMAPTPKAHKSLLEIEGSGIPIVLFDRKVPNFETHYVGVDNRESVKHCVLRMLDQGLERIALVTIPTEAETIRERIQGYKDALKERHKRSLSALICTVDPKDVMGTLTQQFRRLFKLTPSIQAIFFTNNMTSYSGYLLLERDFPEELSRLQLASFDDMDYFEFTKPRITGIEQPEKYISSNCAQLIMDSIEGHIREPKEIKLETNIRWRM
ncbi:MAG: LacI family transcriptional regulator [Puniceicoccaceae bacterium 5H]|nr:MAG: LacI family transcriptional regulator [Puniceicoccaceae bacterium 5H]